MPDDGAQRKARDIQQPTAEAMTAIQRRNARLLATYGITEDQYNAMLAAQSGLCAICHRAPSPGHVLVVDHNHDTGVVRGLLCSECNTGLGLLGDDPSNLRSAITYLGLHGDYPRGEAPTSGTVPTSVEQSHPDLQDKSTESEHA